MQIFPLMVWLAITSLLAFALMAIDKRQARRGGRRVRERDLLLAAAIGGTAGTLAAIVAFRHKSRKARFLVPLAIIIAGQIAVAWAWLR